MVVKMYVIIMYDVDSKRCNKYRRICEDYLINIQNSVFAGTITNAKFTELNTKLNKIKIQEDSLIIYKSPSIRYLKIEGDYNNDTGMIYLE